MARGEVTLHMNDEEAYLLRHLLNIMTGETGVQTYQTAFNAGMYEIKSHAQFDRICQQLWAAIPRITEVS